MTQGWTPGNGGALQGGGGRCNRGGAGYPLWFPWCSLLALLGYLTCQTGTSDSAVLRMIARSWLLSAWYSLMSCSRSDTGTVARMSSRDGMGRTMISLPANQKAPIQPHPLTRLTNFFDAKKDAMVDRQAEH